MSFELQMATSKVCSKCGSEKPLDQFYKKHDGKFGKMSYCKVCSVQKTKLWLSKHPGKAREYIRKWNKANGDKKSAATLRYLRKYKDKLKNDPKWLARRRSKNRNYHHKRRAAAVQTDVTPADIRRIQALPCHYCGKLGGTLDHVVPISRGGLHMLANIVPACIRCNSSKQAKTVVEWAA